MTEADVRPLARQRLGGLARPSITIQALADGAAGEERLDEEARYADSLAPGLRGFDLTPQGVVDLAEVSLEN